MDSPDTLTIQGSHVFLAVQDKLNVSEEAAPQTFTHIRHMSPVPAKSLFRTERQ